MMFLRSIPVALILMLSGAGSVSGQTCMALTKSLGISQDELKDGVTYVPLPGGWGPLSGLSGVGLTGPTNLRGLYVVKDLTGRERNGVVVIKSGRTGLVLPPAPPADVRLVRKNNGSCGRAIRFRQRPDSLVPGDVYDRFHDFGIQRDIPKAELLKLGNFHTNYGVNCEYRTDSDPGGWGRHVSNRASFSYTPDVVDDGGYTGLDWVAGSVRFGRAANAQGVARQFVQRTTEIKPYVTRAGFACLPVTINYIDEKSFFWTNDLAGPFGSGGKRENRY